MTQENPNLRETLSEVHQQLAAAEHVDPEVRELMRQVLADIDRLLVRSSASSAAVSGSPSETDSLVRRLSETARHFEESHPTLFGAVGSAVDALSRMGI